MEIGAGIKSETLPACRYWNLLNGTPKRYVENEIKPAVRSREADFIIATACITKGFTLNETTAHPEYISRQAAFLQSCGYERIALATPTQELPTNQKPTHIKIIELWKKIPLMPSSR